MPHARPLWSVAVGHCCGPRAVFHARISAPSGPSRYRCGVCTSVELGAQSTFRPHGCRCLRVLLPNRKRKTQRGQSGHRQRVAHRALDAVQPGAAAPAAMRRQHRAPYRTIRIQVTRAANVGAFAQGTANTAYGDRVDIERLFHRCHRCRSFACRCGGAPMPRSHPAAPLHRRTRPQVLSTRHPDVSDLLTAPLRALVIDAGQEATHDRIP